MGVAHDDVKTSKNTTHKTFLNTSKKNPKDDDIPETEQDNEDAKKAFKWHENYAEEEGDDLNYQDWKEAQITRFQDTYDLATLEKKLSKLTQKPEENCRAFVSRLNNLYDNIAGQEERADHNQTIIEEATDDKERSAVIAGITHHEKQQGDKIQLLEQKLTEALSKLKCANTKRGSSQENDITITAADQYEKDHVQVNATQDHVTRECDLLTIITAENQVEKEVSVKTETTAPIAETTIRQDEEIIILQDTGNTDFYLNNNLHIGMNTPIGKETTTDQTLNTRDIKRVITATNIYSNNIILATILEPLKIEK
ncbi:hypothetical protein OUZ56_011740 [Daphnia magna]|uniref:Retrotransposon gag domain-containing protein n=1 Tax=Daphnia magna TaxID=35525 RepID=A0ABQ9Z128_9CRUS|nr:hypothetical protein OUZ56_011740 [Daphnia magna]